MPSSRSALSIAATSEDEAEDEIETIPLRTKVLNVVKSCPDNTIRPAKLSQELGLSIEDASANLCGLLRLCKPGSSSFKFETINGVQTMVFVFPPDVEQQALASQRKEDWQDNLRGAARFALKVLKMLTAFGLILSTIIVSVAGVVAMVAALIALSRGGGESRTARNHVSRQLQNLFLTLRQLLWCYAMFGPAGEGEDPFMRDAAYDTSLMLSLCCGNPGSFWFWIRARHLQERRRRRRRGWTRSGDSLNDHDDYSSGFEGVSLIQRGERGEEIPVPPADLGNRGLLSVAVEFLFGSTVSSGPSQAEKWKLRSAVIVQKSTIGNSSISLQEFIPYSDSPPDTLEDKPRVVSEGLLVVSHFNGQPVKCDEPVSEDLSKAKFCFPELISEGNTATNYRDIRIGSSVDNKRSLFDGFFYAKETNNEAFTGSNRVDLPKCLLEEYKVFSKLTSKEFFRCLIVALLNFLGVVWFDQSLNPDGILHDNLGSFGTSLKWGLIPVLQFYAKLFFIIPSIRIAYLLGWNELCKRRNLRRAYLASSLDHESSGKAIL